MKSLKKAISVLLCAIILITAAPLSGFVGLKFPELDFGKLMRTLNSVSESITPTASAASGTFDGGSWQIRDTTKLLIKCTGAMPDYSDGSAPWYDKHNTITEIYFYDGITRIGDYAFYSCSNVTKIGSYTTTTVKDGTKNVTKYVYYNELPSGITSIGNDAFYHCVSLETVNFPQNLQQIESFAFMECYSLNNLTFPNGLESIGKSAFIDCYRLETISFGNNLKHIGEAAFYGCTNLKDFTFPEKLESIGDNAFSLCEYLTSVTLPNSIQTLGEGAFENCYNLSTVVFPDNMRTIPAFLFSSCNNLSEVKFSSDSVLETIGERSFHGCTSLTELQIPATVTSIGDNAFRSCYNLSEVKFSSDSVLETIGENSFLGCTSLTEIQIPATVRSIGYSAFYWCRNLTKVIFFPTSVLGTIGENSFNGCTSLTEIQIPATVRSIGNSAFYCCLNLTKVIFSPASVLGTIGENSFFGCTSLTEIQIPATVRSIGDDAFYDCDNLFEIEFLSIAPPTVTSGIFGDSAVTSIKIPLLSEIPGWNQYATTGWQDIPVVDSNDPNDCPIVSVDASNTDQYGFTYNSFDAKNHTVYCEEYNGSGGDVDVPRAVIKDGVVYYVTAVAEYIFDDKNTTGIQNTTVTSLTLPNTYIASGYNPFSYCTALESVNIESGHSYLTSVDGVVFSSDKTTIYLYPPAKSNASYTIPAQVEYIAERAFMNTQKLKTVPFASGSKLKNIGYQAFYNSTALESVTFPSGLTSLGGYAFSHCRNLKTVSFPSNYKLTHISQYAFSDCNSLNSVSLPYGLQSIGASAFEGCTLLKSINIPSGVYVIYSDAFRATGLEEITLPAGITNINSGAFSDCQSLKAINMDSSSTPFSTVDGVLYKGGVLHTYPAGKTETEFIVPATVNEIFDYAFYGCHNLSKISLAENSKLYGINSYAFSSCSDIHTIDLSNCKNKFYIDAYAFAYCENLTTIDFCDNAQISAIYWDVFNGCSNLKSIPLEKCSAISSVNCYAFSGSSLETLTFSCETPPQLSSTTQPFSDTLLTKIYVTDLYTKPGWDKYLDSGFGGIPLVNKSTTGEVISSVDESDTDSLGFTYNNFNSSTPSVNIKSFSGSGNVVIPRYIIKNGNHYFVRSFNADVFAGNKNITSISFNDQITTLPDSAFSGCTSLKSVSFTNSVNIISDYAFSGCTALETVTTIDELTKIGNGAFYNCSSLSSISLNSGLTSIGNDAFYGCKSLPENLIIPAKVKSIGERAFYNCALRTVQFEGVINTLGKNAFSENKALTRAKFKANPPENVGTTPFGSNESFVIVYPDSNSMWLYQVKDFKWKGYSAYPYSLISQLNSDDAYPIIIMTVTPDGTPFKGATVKLGDKTGTSNDDGIALFTFPDDENQTLTVTPGDEKYFETSKTITLSRRSPVIISSLVSTEALIEVTVDDKDTDISPAVFNTGCADEVTFKIKALAKDIESIELLSGDKPIRYFKEKPLFSSDELYTGDALENGVERDVELCLFTEKKAVSLKVTKKDGSVIPVALNITVYYGGQSVGFKISGKDENDKPKYAFDPKKTSLPEATLDLSGCGINILKDISIDLKLDDIIGALEFKLEQEKDCAKFYAGISTEDESAIKKWAVTRKEGMFRLGEPGKIGCSLEGTVGGYIKVGCTSDYRDFIKESCLFLAVKATAEFGATWWVVIPLRLEISLSGEIVIKIGLTRAYEDNPMKFLLEADFTLALKMRLGMGVKAVSAGIFGQASVSKNLPSHVSTISGEFGAYVKVLFFKYDYTLFKGSRTFGGIQKQLTPAQQLIMQPELYDTSLYEPIEVLEPSLWNSSAVDEGETISLQDSTYIYTHPKLISTDNTVMMVFERLNSSLEVQNSQELVFSLFDSAQGSWSEPQPIQPGDEKFDNNFELYTDGTDIYVAFTQSNSVNDSNVDTAEESVTYQDVYVAKYNAAKGSFDTPEEITQNNIYDVNADIAVIDGIPTAVWVRNENNNPFTLDNSNSIYISRYENGQWGDEIQLAAGLNSITGLDIGELDGKSYIAVATDSDNDIETPDDSKLYLIDTDKNIINKPMDDFGGSCEFVSIGGKDVLLSYCNGKAMTISGADKDAENFAEVPEMGATSGAQFIEYEEGMYAISYLSMNETGGCVRAVTFDGNEWHEAITLSESEDYIGAYALDYRDGQFIVIMREDDLTFTSETEFNVNSTLGGIAFTPSEEMYVSEAVIDSTGIIPGEEFTAALSIVNNSVGHSQYANVILRDANGNEISSAIVEVDIASGESKYVDVTLTAPYNISGSCTITVEPVSMARTMSFRSTPVASSAKEPKAFDISLSAADLCVEAQQVALGSSQNILVNITNDGSTVSDGGMLYVREGDAVSNEAPFTQIETGSVNPGETKSFLIEIPGEIYEDGDGIVTAYIESEGDFYTMNNRSTIAILMMSEGKIIYTPDENASPELSVSYIETDLYETVDKTVKITLNDCTFISIDGLTSGTHYSFSGNTLTLKKAYLSSLTTGSHDITLNFKGEYENYTETLTVLVTDSSPTPLSGSVTISGTAVSGKTLVADLSAVSPTDAEYDIQWYSGSTVVSTESTYKVRDEDIGKKLYVKLTAKGDYTGTLTSNPVTVEKTAGVTEFAPVEASKTCNSITLNKMTGYEYRLANGSWTTNVSFTGLKADTEYTFYARKAETNTAYAGAESVATVIKTVPHTEGSAPTCTSTQKCTVCNAEIAPTNPHTPGSAATCTEPQICTVCKTELIPATNHKNRKNIAAVAATCSETGFTAGVYCDDCDKYISGHKETGVNSSAHKWNNGEITTVATCKVEGIKTYTCQYDKNHTRTENLGLNASNHVSTRDTEEVKATCSETGFKAGVYCDDCDKYISGHEVSGVDSSAHKWNNGEITTVATCKVEGIKTYTCQYNSNHTYTENLGLNASNHVSTRDTEEVHATCSETGFTAGVYCDDCNKYISGHKVSGVDSSAHKWNNGEITTVATCKVEGIKTYTCQYNSNHTYTENLGLNTSNHADTKKTAKTEAGCTSIGYTEGVYCNSCKKYVSGHKEIPASGHDYKSTVTAPNCTNEGFTTHTCTRCKDTYTDTKVKANGHKWGEWKEILAPTLTFEGKEERTCSVCKLRETRKTAKLTLEFGDLDGNGKITAADARLALRASVGLTSFNEAEITAGDIDGNGKITAADARLILRASVGLEDLKKYKK